MRNVILFLLVLVATTFPAYAQRTGGSFGGSSWGSRSSSSSPSRGSSRTSTSPSRTSTTYRSSPARTYSTPVNSRQSSPRGGTTVVVVNHHEHSSSVFDDDDGDSEPIDLSELDPTVSAICGGIGLLVLGVLLAINRRHNTW
jgi:hypothetical protein